MRRRSRRVAIFTRNFADLEVKNPIPPSSRTRRRRRSSVAATFLNASSRPDKRFAILFAFSHPLAPRRQLVTRHSRISSRGSLVRRFYFCDARYCAVYVCVCLRVRRYVMVGRSIHMKLRAIYICIYIERERWKERERERGWRDGRREGCGDSSARNLEGCLIASKLVTRLRSRCSAGVLRD